MPSIGRSLLIMPLALAVYPYHWFRHRAQRNAEATEMSMNDPQWGGKKKDEPPDLAEIFDKINKKITGLFGGKAGGVPPKTGGPSGAAMGGGLAIALALGIFVWLATGFYIVQEGTKGVETRLGRFTQITESGARWHIPYPFEKVEIVDVSNVKSVEVGHRNGQKTKVKEEALMLTEDQNIVDLHFAVQYTLSDPQKVLFNNVLDSKRPDEFVRQIAETTMREIVGKSKMDFVLYEGRADIGARAKLLMQNILDRYKTGIVVSTVTMQNAQPPEQVQNSFDDVVRAKQERERLKNEGEAYANDLLPKARGKAARLAEEAQGHKQSVIATAEGDASRFSQVLVEYEKAPAVTRERIYLDAMQVVMQSASKVVVDQKAGQNLLYLPLDKLMQMPAAPAEVAVPRAVETVPTITTEASRTRDIRTREGR